MANAVKSHWRNAAKKTRYLKDPWESLGFEELPEILVARHIYNPKTKTWWKDNKKIKIKMESKPFAKGAMRECYRMKKLSKFSHQPDWENASNYVAKRYMQEQPRNVYEDDVKLQMDSKLWGERYNSKNPPKKVDFCQAYLIEKESEGGETIIYCVEHYIDGKYIKYNSNSGFVSDINRLTPQAFSHFTFEESSHQSIVVDIQGVGDLYTDPQMHTTDLTEYGEANLSTRGMALFFSSHLCSPLCASLGLTQFDLSPQEVEQLQSQKWQMASPETVVGGLESSSSDSLSSLDVPSHHKRHESVCEAFQRIRLTLDLSSRNETSPVLIESPLMTPKSPPSLNNFNGVQIIELDNEGQEDKDFEEQEDKDFEAQAVKFSQKQGSRSASVLKEVHILQDMAAVKQKLQTLGQVHFELCLYHIIGRFTNKTPDLDSAIFHLQKAGDCGSSKALYLLGCIYQQLPHQQLEEIQVENCGNNKFLGFMYFLKAAESGIRVAMAIVAQAFETGSNLTPETKDDDNDLINGYLKLKPKEQDWNEAVSWYLQALETPPIDNSELDDFAPDHPDYTLLAKLAYLYETGGFGLEIDYQKAGDYYQQAGESAMESMKGKLANKYFMSAEECWSQL